MENKTYSAGTLRQIQAYIGHIIKLLEMENVAVKMPPRARSKGELAKAAGVSLDTFNEWLRSPRVRAALQEMGAYDGQRVFSPRQVEFICDMYGIVFG